MRTSEERRTVEDSAWGKNQADLGHRAAQGPWPFAKTNIQSTATITGAEPEMSVLLACSCVGSWKTKRTELDNNQRSHKKSSGSRRSQARWTARARKADRRQGLNSDKNTAAPPRDRGQQRNQAQRPLGTSYGFGWHWDRTENGWSGNWYRKSAPARTEKPSHRSSRTKIDWKTDTGPLCREQKTNSSEFLDPAERRTE
jgi:hypothetical protein